MFPCRRPKVNVYLLLTVFVTFFRGSFAFYSLTTLWDIQTRCTAYSAECILKYGRYAVPANGVFIPPQYPFGFPLLTTVFCLLFGISEEAAKYCMAFYGFIAIPLIDLLSIRVFNDKRVGIVTATFLAVCPLHWFYSTAVMGTSSACSSS